MSKEILFYVDEFTDEVLPCAPTLKAWATWLASLTRNQGAAGEGPWRAIIDGEVFDVSRLRREPNVTATRVDAERWTYRPEPAGTATFFAETLGDSWDAEMSSDNLDDLLKVAVEMGGVEVGDEYEVAVCTSLPGIRARFTRTPEGGELTELPPPIVYVRTPCPTCGAVTAEEAETMCTPTQDESGEWDCVSSESEDEDGFLRQPSADSLKALDRWIDRETDRLDRMAQAGELTLIDDQVGSV